MIEVEMRLAYSDRSILCIVKSNRFDVENVIKVPLSPYLLAIIKHHGSENFQSYIDDILYLGISDKKGSRIIRTRGAECSYYEMGKSTFFHYGYEMREMVVEEVSRFARYMNLDEKLKFVFTGESNQRHFFPRQLTILVNEMGSVTGRALEFSQFEFPAAEKFASVSKFRISDDFKVYDRDNLIGELSSLEDCYIKIGNYIFDSVYVKEKIQ